MNSDLEPKGLNLAKSQPSRVFISVVKAFGLIFEKLYECLSGMKNFTFP